MCWLFAISGLLADFLWFSVAVFVYWNMEHLASPLCSVSYRLAELIPKC